MFNRFKRSTYRARPIPELLDGEDWEVRNSNNLKKAYVDFSKRQFVVPFEESSEGELVRAHEAMHVKITPRDFHRPDDMDFVTLQSIEDCRVHQGLRVCGINTLTPKGAYSDKELEKAFENPNLQHPLRQAEVIFATRGLREEKKSRELVNPKVCEIVDSLYEKYFAEDEKNSQITSFEDAMKCAEELKELLQIEFPEMPMPAPGGGNEGKGKPGDSGDQNENLTYSFKPGGTDEEGQISIEALTEEEKAEARESGIERFNDRGANFEFEFPSQFDKPGTMSIEYPKLDHRLKLKTTDSIKMTPSDEGVIPTRMHRYATDQKLFSRKGKRRAGAAVLIDVSGSMSLSNEMILDIIKQCPASIVAIYSGHGHNKGILRIVAEEGKYNVDLKKGMGGSNIIDIPAIEWLAKRKEKRKFWISDGWITCIRERMAYDEDIRKLTNTMRQAKIERVGDVRSFLASGKLIDHAFDDGHEIGRSYKK